MIVRCFNSNSSVSDKDESTEAITFIQTFIINFIEAAIVETKVADSIEELDIINTLDLEKVDSLILKNEERGLKYIENIMNEWRESSELKAWCYHINCINKKDEPPFYFYVYEVKWSKPMHGYTFPIISVNVYVFLTMNSQDCEETIDMKYIFEGNRFVHSKDTSFYPKFLIDAYENKKSVIARLHFKYQLE